MIDRSIAIQLELDTKKLLEKNMELEKELRYYKKRALGYRNRIKKER